MSKLSVKLYEKWYTLINYSLQNNKCFTFIDLKILSNIILCLILLNNEKKNILESLEKKNILESLEKKNILECLEKKNILECGIITPLGIAIYNNDLKQITFITPEILFKKIYKITHLNQEITEYQIGFFR